MEVPVESHGSVIYKTLVKGQPMRGLGNLFNFVSKLRKHEEP
jgi:hypothetical protein